MKTILKLFALILVFPSCTFSGKDHREQYKNEILDAEKAFVEMARTDGVPAAFLRFAAEDAVLNRGGLIIGKDSIGNDIDNKGVFHTVWKRQADGEWRFVWD